MLTGGAGSVVSGASSRRAGSLYRQVPLLPVPGVALDAANGMPNIGVEQLTPQQLGAMGEYHMILNNLIIFDNREK